VLTPASSPADDWDRLFEPAVTPWEDPPTATSNAAPAIRYLGFRLGAEGYAAPIADLTEVVRVPPVTFVPRVRSFVRGVATVRGTVLPIIDLRRRLLAGPEDEVDPVAAVPAPAPGPAPVLADRHARLLVTRIGGEAQGLLVDAVDDVFALDPGDIEAPPAHLPRRLVDLLTGVTRREGRLLLLLDLRVLLDFTAPLPHARRRLEAQT
jgi:purine-binding chemotaxis protein CheW